MPGRPRKFEGPLRWVQGLLADLERQARLAFPSEACGLLLGEREGNGLFFHGAIPAKNLRVEEGRFLLDPRAWLEAEERRAALRVPWHSHPGGCPFPSREDCLLLERQPLIGIAHGAGSRFHLAIWTLTSRAWKAPPS